MDSLIVVADDIPFYVAVVSAIDGVGSIPGNSASQNPSIIFGANAFGIVLQQTKPMRIL